MKTPATPLVRLLLISTFGLSAPLIAQPPGGPGGPGGRGGGPAQAPEVKLVSQFDKDGDKILNTAERAAAREHLRANPVPRRGGGFGRGGAQTTPQPGVQLTAADVKSYGSEGFYDLKTLRTLFLQFEGADWEKEMEDFNNTDVDVPATLAVDGKIYRDVGVHFRGASSYFTVGTGQKRSLNISLDHAHEKQTIMGFRTLNLLNSHGDSSFLRPVLYSRIAQDYLAAPRVNFVRVVINGENWGVYSSAEQFNKDFAEARFGISNGARWKVPGSPNGRGSLAYLGDDAAAYKAIYEIKSKDNNQSWAKLIKLCKVLNETAPAQLEAALAPLLDVDSALKFLALEMTLVNADGYWTRTSDYSIAEDAKGRFHIIPHDMNETFNFNAGGRGGGRGPGAPGAGPGGGQGGNAGIQLDPLAIATNTTKPLAEKLLAVPAFRARYLGYVRDIAEKWLDWSKLGPVAQELHTLIDADVKRDTRKLESYEDFATSVDGSPRSLKAFAEQRREFLLNLPAIKDLPRTTAAPR